MQLSLHVEAVQNDLAAVAGMADEQTRDDRPAHRRRARVVAPPPAPRGGHGGGATRSRRSSRPATSRSGSRAATRRSFFPTRRRRRRRSAPRTPHARITLRLPETLKASVEAAAAREGISVNAWLVQALARSIDRRGGPARSSRPDRLRAELKGEHDGRLLVAVRTRRVARRAHEEHEEPRAARRSPCGVRARRPLTLRVPSSLKRRLDESAELAGVSREAFVERALARSVDPRLGV